jgi:hypothetical protein
MDAENKSDKMLFEISYFDLEHLLPVPTPKTAAA